MPECRAASFGVVRRLVAFFLLRGGSGSSGAGQPSVRPPSCGSLTVGVLTSLVLCLWHSSLSPRQLARLTRLPSVACCTPPSLRSYLPCSIHMTRAHKLRPSAPKEREQEKASSFDTVCTTSTLHTSTPSASPPNQKLFFISLSLPTALTGSLVPVLTLTASSPVLTNTFHFFSSPIVYPFETVLPFLAAATSDARWALEGSTDAPNEAEPDVYSCPFRTTVESGSFI